MSDYRVLRDFAFEGRLYSTGQILRQSNPLEARLIKEWSLPGFFSAEADSVTKRAPVRRKPKRDWLTVEPPWRLP